MKTNLNRSHLFAVADAGGVTFRPLRRGFSCNQAPDLGRLRPRELKTVRSQAFDLLHPRLERPVKKPKPEPPRENLPEVTVDRGGWTKCPDGHSVYIGRNLGRRKCHECAAKFIAVR